MSSPVARQPVPKGRQELAGGFSRRITDDPRISPEGTAPSPGGFSRHRDRGGRRATHDAHPPPRRLDERMPTAESCGPCKAALATMRLRRPLRGLVSWGRLIPGFPLVTLGYVCAAPGRGLRRSRPSPGGSCGDGGRRRAGAARMAPVPGRELRRSRPSPGGSCGDGGRPRAGAAAMAVVAGRGLRGWRPSPGGGCADGGRPRAGAAGMAAVPGRGRGDGADPRAGMRGAPWTRAQSPAGQDAGEDRGRRRFPHPRGSARILGPLS